MCPLLIHLGVLIGRQNKVDDEVADEIATGAFKPNPPYFLLKN